MNKRGVVLILSYAVIATLTLLAAAYLTSSISERNIVKRSSDAKRAFWIAEAGMSRTYRDIVNQAIGVPAAGDTIELDEVEFPDDSNQFFQITLVGQPYGTEIRATGIIKDPDNPSEVIAERAVSGVALWIPNPLQNTISTGGDLIAEGFFGFIGVEGKTRISGGLIDNGTLLTLQFEDKEEGSELVDTTIQIPDFNNNGTPDEFGDFVSMGRNAVQIYVPQTIDWDSLEPGVPHYFDQAVYLKSNDAAYIFPAPELFAGKKILYIEGDNPGDGDAFVFFDTTLLPDEDVTIISTGKATYYYPLVRGAENSRVNFMSWDDYYRTSAIGTFYTGSAYTHGKATMETFALGAMSTANIIANDDITLREVLVLDHYRFSDRAISGDLPPGFQLLGSSSPTDTPKLEGWEELMPSPE